MLTSGRHAHGPSLNKAFLCPVCGLNTLDVPREMEPVCPACGTDFGGNDSEVWGVQHLRQEWIDAGAPWFSSFVQPPPDWLDIQRRILREGV